MHYKTKDGIAIIEGLEVIRRRPAMYIGTDEPDRSLRRRLLELVVDGVVRDTPKPREVRVALWRDDAITVAYDGEPMPIEPFSARGAGVAHPALYEFFLHLFAGADPLGRTLSFCALLNALSERLVVSTMHAGQRYRAVFSRGMVVSLLTRTWCEAPLGTTWLTFHPDETIITGASLTRSEVQALVDGMVHEVSDVPVVVQDRTTDEADWY